MNSSRTRLFASLRSNYLCSLIVMMLLPLPAFAQSILSLHDQVQQMYVAYYGRPGDAAGLTFWENRLSAANGDLADIINEFGNSDEFVDRFGSLDNNQLVNQIFLSVFGRQADAEGLEFYVTSLAAGERTLGAIALDIVNGAAIGSDDHASIINKITVANYVSSALQASGANYTLAIVDTLRDVLEDVTADFSEFTALYTSIDELAATLANNGDEPEPIIFRCNKDSSCPEVLITGDPFATSNNLPQAFRGYGDPSLEFDPQSGILWLAYSWLDVVTVVQGPPPEPDLLVRTHLARSLDNGSSFEFVRAINTAELVNHSFNAQQGWLIHEVPTLALQPDGQWQTLWLQYFNPTGKEERYEFQYNRSLAATPQQAGDSQQAWARTTSTTAAFDAALRFDGIPEIGNCTLHTEPALFTHEGVLYLATHCLVVDGSGRRPDLERLVLLRDEGSSYAFVGNLLNAADFAGLGGNVVTQPDLSVSRDGTVLLTVTPKLFGEDPEHQGCVVLAVADISQARVARDASGAPVRRAVITAEGNSLGPGLCTYDPNSNTGVLLVITTFTTDPVDIEFSLRATGVHP